MKQRMLRTAHTKAADVDHKWHIVDATGMVLGRLATEVANTIRGKNKVLYTPSADTGDFVIVINAEKIVATGKKLSDKIYYRHSGYPGGLKKTTLKEQLEKFPERAIEHAVRGMLPKGPLGRRLFTKLKVYSGSSHPHEAQQPSILDLKAVS